MKDRLKELRKQLGLTMEEFGSKLGVGKTAISSLEKGVNNLTKQMILSICNTYNVNEEWLRNGSGEMFVENSNSIIEKIVSEYPLDTLSINILKTYIELNPREREVFNSVIKGLASNIMANKKGTAINNSTNEAQSEKETFLRMAENEYEKEKEQESSASSVKKSDVV